LILTSGFTVSAHAVGSCTVKVNVPPFQATSNVSVEPPFCLILRSGSAAVFPSPKSSI
jgi:hypothetical protein